MLLCFSSRSFDRIFVSLIVRVLFGLFHSIVHSHCYTTDRSGSCSLFLSVHYNNLTIHKHLLLFVRFNSNSNSIQAIAHISKLSIDFPLESQTINILRFTKCSIVHVHWERDSFSCILCWNVFENINTRTQSSMLKIWVDLIEEEKHRISMVLFGIFRLCGRREDWRTYSFDKKKHILSGSSEAFSSAKGGHTQILPELLTWRHQQQLEKLHTM